MIAAGAIIGVLLLYSRVQCEENLDRAWWGGGMSSNSSGLDRRQMQSKQT